MVKNILIFIGILFFVFILFNYVAMPFYVKHSGMVTVPNVSGKSFDEAKKVLENAGLEVKQGEIRYDENKAIGLVLDQNPPADQVVKSNRRIYLTVNGGEQLVEVPRLSGRSMRDAKFTLEQRNLQIGEVVKKFSNQYPEDVVISQVTQPGSKVKRASKVDVIISNGPQIGNLMIPDLYGKKLEEVKKILAEKKLKLGKITYQPSDDAPGVIVDQYPKKDKSANEGTEVQIFVTKKRVVEKPKDDEGGTGDDNGNKKSPTDNKTEKNEVKEKKLPEKPKQDTKIEKPKEVKPKKEKVN